MKKGFEIYLQKDLTPEERQKALGFVNDFIAKTCGDSRFRYFGRPGGGYTTGLWRGRFGISLDHDNQLVFRRISKNVRKFGVVRATTMLAHNDKPFCNVYRHDNTQPHPDGEIDAKMCICPRHKGSVRVKWRGDKPPEMEFYAKIGEPKG